MHVLPRSFLPLRSYHIVQYNKECFCNLMLVNNDFSWHTHGPNCRERVEIWQYKVLNKKLFQSKDNLIHVRQKNVEKIKARNQKKIPLRDNKLTHRLLFLKHNSPQGESAAAPWSHLLIILILICEWWYKGIRGEFSKPLFEKNVHGR